MKKNEDKKSKSSSKKRYTIVNTKTIEDLKYLYDHSAFTFEGLSTDGENVEALMNFLDEKKITYTAPLKIYVTLGKLMNDVYELSGGNKYKDNLTIVSLSLEDIESPALPMIKLQIGARWFDDIVDNNADRGGRSQSDVEGVEDEEEDQEDDEEIEEDNEALKPAYEFWFFNDDSTKDSEEEYEDEDDVELDASNETYKGDWSYFDKYIELTDSYLPQTGEGETMAEQLITAAVKLIYKWFNDGDVYDNTAITYSGPNDLSSYANWLYRYIEESEEILESIFNIPDNDKAQYENILKSLADALFNEEILEEYSVPKEGSIYECNGPFSIVDEDDDEDYEVNESVKPAYEFFFYTDEDVEPSEDQDPDNVNPFYDKKIARRMGQVPPDEDEYELESENESNKPDFRFSIYKQVANALVEQGIFDGFDEPVLGYDGTGGHVSGQSIDSFFTADTKLATKLIVKALSKVGFRLFYGKDVFNQDEYPALSFSGKGFIVGVSVAENDRLTIEVDNREDLLSDDGTLGVEDKDFDNLLESKKASKSESVGRYMTGPSLESDEPEEDVEEFDDEPDIQSGDYVIKKYERSGKIYKVSDADNPNLVWIGDKDNVGWYMYRSDLQLVDPDDPRIEEFESSNESKAPKYTKVSESFEAQSAADVEVGDKIQILVMEGEPQYSGRVGIVEHIDDIGQLHGTWGGLAVDPKIDTIIVTKKLGV